MPCPCYIHFNSTVEHMPDTWYCEECSCNFNQFIKQFLKLNVDPTILPENFENIEKSRQYRVFVDYIKTIVSIMNMFENLIGSVPSHNSKIYSDYIQEEYKDFKFPVTELITENLVFGEFIKSFVNSEQICNGIRYLTITDIEAFYTYCVDYAFIRPDILTGTLEVTRKDLNYLNSKYRIEVNIDSLQESEEYDFNHHHHYHHHHDHHHHHVYPEMNMDNLDPYEQEHYANMAEYEGIQSDSVYECYSTDEQSPDGKDDSQTFFKADYNKVKKIFLNYFDTFYCFDCYSKYKYIECYSEDIYIKSLLISELFNTITSYKYRQLLHSEEDLDSLKLEGSKKLVEISNSWNITIPSYKWKGSGNYYKLLQTLPPDLIKAKIPLDHYINRMNGVFEGSIVGHPKASHGLYREILEEADELIDW